MSALKLWGLIAGALFVLTLDFFVKGHIADTLPLASSSFFAFPFGGISVFTDWLGIDFALVHVANKGAAWGMFAAWQEYLLYLRCIVVAGLLIYVSRSSMSLYRRIAFLLISVGALGNVLDYFVHGHVIDMFYFRFWGYSYPVFNIADSAIFGGIALLCFQQVYIKFSTKTSNV